MTDFKPFETAEQQAARTRQTSPLDLAPDKAELFGGIDDSPETAEQLAKPTVELKIPDYPAIITLGGEVTEEQATRMYERLRADPPPKVLIFDASMEPKIVPLPPQLDEAEKEAFDQIGKAMKAIQDLGLKKVDGHFVNAGELASAVHVLQGFVIQRMLERTAPGRWGEWFDLDGAAGDEDAARQVGGSE